MVTIDRNPANVMLTVKLIISVHYHTIVPWNLYNKITKNDLKHAYKSY